MRETIHHKRRWSFAPKDWWENNKDKITEHMTEGLVNRGAKRRDVEVTAVPLDHDPDGHESYEFVHIYAEAVIIKD